MLVKGKSAASMSSSSDSSEDENIEQLRDALDVRFINDSLYASDGKATVSKSDPQKPKVSNRPVPEEVASHHLKVTPEFQSFVSKQLSKFLDGQIKEVEKKRPYVETVARNPSGIYLLRDSSSFLNSEESSEDFVPTQKRKFSRIKTDDPEQDLSGVVVSPEWVLNQEETKKWQKNAKKNPLFCYKKSKKGVLELVSEPS